MKTSIIISCLALLFSLSGCTTDESQSQINPYDVNLNKIEGSNLSTAIKISVTALNGTEISNVSQLSLGQDYRLEIAGDALAFYRIGVTGGFEVVENFNDPVNPGKSARYLIRPVDEIANGLALSIIVIHRTEGTLLRESPKRMIILQQ
jgi:hypothetical protein